MSESEDRNRFAFALANWVPKDDQEMLPIYTEVGRIAAESPELFAAFDHVSETRNLPGLLFGAVHYLLLEGAEHPLADYFPSVCWWRDRNAVLVPGDTADGAQAFLSFLKDFADPIHTVMASHEVQTNEVGRCSYLAGAVAQAQRELGDPSLLVDLGCSAGLNLNLHHSATVFACEDGSEILVGEAHSPLQLRAELHGPSVPTAPLAPHASLGIDLRPIDLSQGDAARWLLALVWAEDLERFQRSAAAINAFLQTEPKPEMITASMLEIDRILETRYEDHPVIVMNSWSAAYLSTEDQQELTAAMQRLAEQRPARWIIAEHPKAVPGLPVAPQALQWPGRTAIDLVDPSSGELGRRLGEGHPHGRWLHWES